MIFDEPFIEPPAPLGSDLEWMLQSSQVSDQALAGRLIQDYHARAVSLALAVLGDERLAEQAAADALKQVVQERRKFWGNDLLQTWIYTLLVRQVLRRANWLWRWRRRRDVSRLPSPASDDLSTLRRRLLNLDVTSLLPLALVYGHELDESEAAAALGIPGETLSERLALALERLSAPPAPLLAQVFNLHRSTAADSPEQQPHAAIAAEAQPEPSSPAQERFHRRLLSQVALSLSREGRSRSWRRLAGELALGILGVSLALLVGFNALAQEPLGTPGITPRVTVVLVEITATPQPGEVYSLDKALLVLPYGSQLESDAQDPKRPTALPTSPPRARQVEINMTLAIAGAQTADPGLSTWQNSGPYTLAVLMRYLGVEIDVQQVSADLRPNPEDTGIFPYEIEEYVAFQAPLRAVYRFGGSIEEIRGLLETGLPVLLQRTYAGADVDGWAAEYVLVTAFDDVRQQVRLLRAGSAQVWVSYQELLDAWLPFGFAYLAVFSPERSSDLYQALGPHFEDSFNYPIALKDLKALELDSDLEQFWILFSQGTIQTYQSDFANAAQAYDSAFEIYLRLPASERPWRALWYNTRPYWAYYYHGRYAQVVALADETISNAGEIGLEESLYWRALAYESLGNRGEAMLMLKQAIELNPNFAPGLFQLERMQGGG